MQKVCLSVGLWRENFWTIAPILKLCREVKSREVFWLEFGITQFWMGPNYFSIFRKTFLYYSIVCSSESSYLFRISINYTHKTVTSTQNVRKLFRRRCSGEVYSSHRTTSDQEFSTYMMFRYVCSYKILSNINCPV